MLFRAPVELPMPAWPQRSSRDGLLVPLMRFARKVRWRRCAPVLVTASLANNVCVPCYCDSQSPSLISGITSECVKWSSGSYTRMTMRERGSCGPSTGNLASPVASRKGRLPPKRAILGILLDVMVIRLDFTRTWPPFSRDRAGHLHALLVGAAPVANEGSEADSWR